MSTLPRSQNAQRQIISAISMHFPHLKNLIMNPQVSFSENLENIVAHISEPDRLNLFEAISGMKEAVDMQQLKIQKSLVNNDALNNITNHSKKESTQYEFHKINNIREHSISDQLIVQQQSQNSYYYEESVKKQEDIIQEIWKWDDEDHRNDRSWLKR